MIVNIDMIRNTLIMSVVSTLVRKKPRVLYKKSNRYVYSINLVKPKIRHQLNLFANSHYQTNYK